MLCKPPGDPHLSRIGGVICPSPLNMHLEAIRLLLKTCIFRGALLPLVVLGWASNLPYTTHLCICRFTNHSSEMIENTTRCTVWKLINGDIELPLCLSVRLGLWELHCAPPQQYRTTLCTTDLHCAPWCKRGTYSSIFVVDNELANQGSQCSSVPMYTLVVHNVALCWLGGAQDGFACRYGPLPRWCTIRCCQFSYPSVSPSVWPE